MTLKIKTGKNGIEFAATIQPRASKNEICGLHNDTLKIRLTSPPVEGEANSQCIKFLAKQLGVSPSQVSIVRGHTGRNKIIHVEGISESALINHLLAGNRADKDRK